MNKNIILDDKFYTDAPQDVEDALAHSVEVSADFLPSPEELKKAATKKIITIRLDSANVEFFKNAAKERGSHYQTMINDLLGEYVKMHRRAV